MKKHSMLVIAFSIIFALGSALTGCGLLGSKTIPKEQINADIANRSVKRKDGTDWTFKSDSEDVSSSMTTKAKSPLLTPTFRLRFRRGEKAEAENTNCI